MCEKSPKTPFLSPPDDYSKQEEAQHVDFSNKNWYIMTGVVERPRSIFGEEVPLFFVLTISWQQPSPPNLRGTRYVSTEWPTNTFQTRP